MTMNSLHVAPESARHAEHVVERDEALRRLDIERTERIKRKPEDPEDPRWSAQFGDEAFSAGVPLVTRRTEGARWFR